MAKKKETPARTTPEKGRLASRPEVKSLFDRLVELCGGDQKDAAGKLSVKADIKDDRTLAKIYAPRQGKERWSTFTDETVLDALRELIQEIEAAAPGPKRRPERVVEYHGAPNAVEGWVARDDSTSKLLDSMWEGGSTRIVQLIADGGEGKSALVRMWLEGVRQADKSPPGFLFWWNFYCNRQVDAFFAALLRFLPREPDEGPPTSLASEQVKRIARRLNRNSILLVLDGFEEMLDSQPQDRLAPIRARELRALLLQLCRENAKSMCVITSRVSVADLECERNCYRHLVPSLSVAVARELLGHLGVTGAERELEDVARSCKGHALTLRLLGPYLARYHDGNIAAFAALKVPGAEAGHQERIAKLLSLHNDQPRASRHSRGLLALFSSLRKPVPMDFAVSLFSAAFRLPELSPLFPASPEEMPLGRVLEGLIQDRLIIQGHGGDQLLLHPLVRGYYYDRLGEYSGEVRVAWHRLVRDQYLKTEPVDEPTDPSQMEPFVEAVHHGCKGQDHDHAWLVTLQQVARGERFLFALGMGQWRTSLELLSDFFPQQDNRPDLKRLPLLKERGHQAYLLTLLGYANLTLGRLEIGNSLMERAANLIATHGVPKISAFAFCTLAEGQMLHGNLYLAGRLAADALQLASSQHDDDGVRRSLVYQAWVRYMRGDRDGMGEVLQDGQRRFSDFPCVDDVHGVGRLLRGIHLFWTGEAAEARELLRATAEACERCQYWNQASRCRRVLGERAGKGRAAKGHLVNAVELAKRSSFQPPLLEALSALGRWYAGNKEYDLADLHIREAMDLSSRDGLNLHHIDARVSHAHLLKARGDQVASQMAFGQAKHESELFGYHWGTCEL